MSLYNRGAHIAAEIFKGDESDAGLIHHELHDILGDLEPSSSEETIKAHFFVKGVCLAWGLINPEKEMFSD